MSREVHVRICEGAGVRLPRATRLNVSWEGKTAYDARCKPIASRQLATAVRNLAALLNKIWS